MTAPKVRAGRLPADRVTVKCAECGESFTTKRYGWNTARFCSHACRQRSYRRRQKRGAERTA